MNKIEKILENIPLPENDDRARKNELRRQLLSLPNFNKRTLNPIKIIVPSVAFAILAVIIFVFYLSIPPDVNSLLTNVKASYAGIMLPGIESKFESFVNIPGENNSSLKLKVEKIVIHSTGDIHIKVIDPSTKEMLDEYIINNDSVYRSKNAKLSTKGLKNSLIDRSFKIKVLSADNVFVFSNKSKSSNFSQKGTNRVFVSEKKEKLGEIIFNKKGTNSIELGINNEQVFSFKVNKNVDFFKILYENPLSLINDFENADSLKIVDNKDSKYSIIETVNAIRVKNIYIDRSKPNEVYINDNSLQDSAITVLRKGDVIRLKEHIYVNNSTQKIDKKVYYSDFKDKIVKICETKFSETKSTSILNKFNISNDFEFYGTLKK